MKSVGNTPLNITLEDANLAKVEVAIGTSQMEESIAPEKADAAIGNSLVSEAPAKNELKDQSVLAQEPIQVRDQSIIAINM